MIAALIAEVWPYIAGVLAIIATLLGFGASQRARGREQERTRRQEEAAQARRDADANAEKIRRLDDDDLVREFDRLRDQRRR